MDTPTPEDLLKWIVQSMANQPDKVEVVLSLTEHSAMFDIHVGDGDFGMIVGKKGIYADSMRRIFGAIYGKSGRRLNLQVIDPRRR
jgi:uncharacterized protein